MGSVFVVVGLCEAENGDQLVDESGEAIPVLKNYYEVRDLEKFFDLYDFDEAEQEGIRERSEEDVLLVYQDGLVMWGDGEVLIEADDELIDGEAFGQEAAEVGAIVEE